MVTYESSDPSIVTVDETGLVTAVANGEADITTTLTQKGRGDHPRQHRGGPDGG